MGIAGGDIYGNDFGNGGIKDAPRDSEIYARSDGEWVPIGQILKDLEERVSELEERINELPITITPPPPPPPPSLEVTIGSQTWMEVNLGVPGVTDTPGIGVFYGNANDEPFPNAGKLYTHEEAVSASLLFPGWHLPDNDEWQQMIQYAGGANAAGTRLKATSGWNDNGNGTDVYGFAALPGGDYYAPSSKFVNIGNAGSWWSRSKNGTSNGFYRQIMAGLATVSSYYSQVNTYKYSVRLVKDS